MNPLLSFKLYGTKAITTTTVYNNNYNTYTDSDRYNYKHYKIPVGTFYTGSAPYLFFTCNNDLYINPTWSNNFYDGLGRFYDGTSFFRNVKMYENTVLSTANFNYEKDIYFYPNPTNNSFKIVLENNMSMDKIMIYDVQGRVVYQKDLYQSNQEQVDINYLEAGVYHVKIETNKGVLSKKVIKN